MKFKELNGRNKFWVLSDSSNAFNLLTNLIDNRSVFDMNLIGEEAYELYRISDGIPKAPNELNDSFNPHEVNLIDEVDFEKGCYIGQEVIARLDTYDKVQRSLKRIRLEYDFEAGDEIPLVDENDNDAGKITSLIKSELKKETIGLALVRRKYLEGDSKIYSYNRSGEKVPITILG
jgi:folate-binding protein YgfZ